MQSLQEYFNELWKEYKFHKNDINFDYEKFLESKVIIDEFNNNYTLKLLNNKQKEKILYRFFSTYQLTLTFEQRKII